METKKKNILRKVILGLWAAIFLSVFLFVIFIYSVKYNWFNLYGPMPSLRVLENPSNELASEIYSADYILLGKYFRENRSPVEYEEISPNIINALRATEDIRFEEHSGVDLRGTFRVAFKTILLRQRAAGGGSTLTQQLAKNLFETRGEQYKGRLSDVKGIGTLIIKTKEWITAVTLEKSYTKDEILSMYLNTVDFGSNSFGIKVAAKTYFNKTPSDVNIQEAAMLVGMLQAPSRYNPKNNPERAVLRRNTVLSQMNKYGFLTKEKFDSLKTTPLEVQYKVENHNEGIATYFRTIVRNYLISWCKEKGYDLFEDGLKIYTTIDSRMQKYAEEATTEHMKFLQQKFYEHWAGKNPWVDEDFKELPNFIENAAKKTDRYKQLVDEYGANSDSVKIIMNRKIPMRIFSWNGEKDTLMSPMDSIRYYKKFLHAGLMSMEKSGAIKAWVGGINHKHFKFDHVSQQRRQTGSTFKAFVYAAAIENGYLPCFEVTDAPVTFENPTWIPVNSDGKWSYEKLTMRQGLAESKNSVAAFMLQKIGVPQVMDIAGRLGINKELLDPVPSVALGSSDVSIYEMVGAYNAFINEGVPIQPYYISKIEDKDGNVLYDHIPRTSGAGIHEETAYLMVHMLQGSTTLKRGSGLGLYRYGLLGENEVGAKTGTTQNNSDGWFIGFTKDLTTGVWVGGDDRSIHFKTLEFGQGSRMALPIWGLYMKKVFEDKELPYKKGRFPIPDLPGIAEKIRCVTSDTTKLDSLSTEIVLPKGNPLDEDGNN
jgi:penicillin-binding protein 1A